MQLNVITALNSLQTCWEKKHHDVISFRTEFKPAIEDNLNSSPAGVFSNMSFCVCVQTVHRDRCQVRFGCRHRAASSIPSPWRWPQWGWVCLCTASDRWRRGSRWNVRPPEINNKPTPVAVAQVLNPKPGSHRLFERQVVCSWTSQKVCDGACGEC